MCVCARVHSHTSTHAPLNRGCVRVSSVKLSVPELTETLLTPCAEKGWERDDVAEKEQMVFLKKSFP